MSITEKRSSVLISGQNLQDLKLILNFQPFNETEKTAAEFSAEFLTLLFENSRQFLTPLFLHPQQMEMIDFLAKKSLGTNKSSTLRLKETSNYKEPHSTEPRICQIYQAGKLKLPLTEDKPKLKVVELVTICAANPLKPLRAFINGTVVNGHHPKSLEFMFFNQIPQQESEVISRLGTNEAINSQVEISPNGDNFSIFKPIPNPIVKHTQIRPYTYLGRLNGSDSQPEYLIYGLNEEQVTNQFEMAK